MKNIENEQNYLEKYGINMNQACQNKILIGRTQELRMIMQTLLRREKNSPMLVGRAGTGKTAILYGLCQMINNNNVPIELRGYTIYSLSMNKIEADACLQGELEARIDGIINYAMKFKNKIILFIDEIHIISKTKFADIIKPHIAAGEIKMIGATTIEEYTKYIEPDKAINRRFRVINVEEPNINETINIVRGIKNHLQEYYSIEIPDKVIQYAASISKRYFVSYNNPDLTLEIIEDTASRIKLERETEPYDLLNLKNKIYAIRLEIESLKLESQDNNIDNENTDKLKELYKKLDHMQYKYNNQNQKWQEEKEKMSQINKYQKQINELNKKIKIYKLNNQFVEVGKILYVELPTIQNKINLLSNETEIVKSKISIQDIRQTISHQTGIGVKQLSYKADDIIKLKQFLQSKIIGQNDAISQICNQLQNVLGGFRDINKPVSIMCFAGPTGVGKTKTAELISEFLFNKQSIKIINMGQYQDRHNSSALFGTTAGYVGYKEEGILTGAIRLKPYRVVLLDEIEKAHPNILDTLLSIFDKGLIEDNAGRLVNFRESTIIMTTNIFHVNNINYTNDESNEKYINNTGLINQMMKFFKPEFINRIDAIINFKEINIQYYYDIIKHILQEEINIFIQNTNMKIIIDDNIYEYLFNLYKDQINILLGVRGVRRMIKSLICSPIIQHILTQNNQNTILIQTKNNQIIIENIK